MSTNKAQHVVAILDAGAQYGKVIDRRVREANIESHLVPLNTPVSEIVGKFHAVIISGSPSSVNIDKLEYKVDPKLFDSGIPILGICFGYQLITKHFGGKVDVQTTREDGQFVVTGQNEFPLFAGLKQQQEVLLTHGDFLKESPAGFQTGAVTEDGCITAIFHPEKRIFGVQFHPEVDLTPNGVQILRNFLINVANLQTTFTLANRQVVCESYVRSTIANAATVIGCQPDDIHVLMLISGGVDSTVCAALFTSILPKERLHFLHIDNGFMRHQESAKVRASLNAIGVELDVVEAAYVFSDSTTMIDGVQSRKLRAAVQPEEKRKIIGDTFMRVADDHIKDTLFKQGVNAEHVILGQGTLRPDLIESASHMASKTADTIKTHHNDTQLVRQLRDAGRVIEPLQTFHKDEVREIGKTLGLPAALVERHPFPGPGLAIRVLCAEEPFFHADTKTIISRLKFLFYSMDGEDRQAETTLTADKLAALRMNISRLKLHFTLLPIKTVGVQGDSRSYSHVVALSSEMSTESTFFNTATSQNNWEVLFLLAKVVPKLCPAVNRVVFVFGALGPRPDFAVKDITPTHLERGVLETIRLADDAANECLRRDGETARLAQMPVVLIPIDFGAHEEGRKRRRSVVLRPFISNDFMTGAAAVPGRHLKLGAVRNLANCVAESSDGVDKVLLDLTSKPPGTTEWE